MTIRKLPWSAIDLEEAHGEFTGYYDKPVTFQFGGTVTREPTVTAKVMGNNEATVAEVSYGLKSRSGKTYTGSGAAKRERGDSPDPVTGELLAMARAFDELASRMFREAKGRIRAQDAERHQKETRRTRAEWEAIKDRPVTLGTPEPEPLPLSVYDHPIVAQYIDRAFSRRDIP